MQVSSVIWTFQQAIYMNAPMNKVNSLDCRQNKATWFSTKWLFLTLVATLYNINIINNLPF